MNDPSSRSIAVAVYLLVADGVAALFLGGLVGPVGLVVLAGLAAGSWWQEPLRQRVERVPRLGVAILALGAVALAAEVAVTAPSMLDVFTHLLVFLLLVKLYTRRTRRDARDVAFLTFFMLVAASPVTTSVVFLALFVTFLVVGTWLLMLRHVSNEADDATPTALPTPPALGFGRDLFNLSLAASGATIAVTALLFVIIPRLGQAALPMQPGGARMVSGFTERVRLGAFGEIEADAAVVMRVQLTQFAGGRGAPEALPTLALAGHRLRPLRRARVDGGPLDAQAHAAPRPAGAVPDPRALRWSGAHPGDPPGAARLGHDLRRAPGGPAAGALRLRHRRRPRQHRGGGPVGPAAVHGRVGAGDRRPAPPAHRRHAAPARRPLAGALHAAAPAVAAHRRPRPRGDGRQRRLLRCRHAPDRLAEPRADLHACAGGADHGGPAGRLPVRATRSGNCEYFAAALAVMLRSLGIPVPRGQRLPAGRVESRTDATSWSACATPIPG